MNDKFKNFGKIFEYRGGSIVCNHSAVIFLENSDNNSLLPQAWQCVTRSSGNKNVS
jgi:hypothetical protein